MEKEILLQVNNLKVVYPKFELNDISFELKRGEIVGLIGENGVGKTTTVNAIMGTAPLFSGEVWVLGELMNANNIANLRQKIGYVGGPLFAYHKVRVEQLIKFLSEIYDNWEIEKEKKFLAEFNIDSKKKVKELSSGMRVKLQILIALCHNADIIIMDEPTSGIDPVTRSEILNILDREAHIEGKTVLFSSHITSDIKAIADNVIIMKDGEIKQTLDIEKCDDINLDEILIELSGRKQ